jgi:hypothetical protein
MDEENVIRVEFGHPAESFEKAIAHIEQNPIIDLNKEREKDRLEKATVGNNKRTRFTI